MLFSFLGSLIIIWRNKSKNKASHKMIVFKDNEDDQWDEHESSRIEL